MPDSSTSNKTIAKNTLLLYVRMLFSMIVGLYTSRVVLQVLGVEDYGIYGVVGGIVTMMGFLNASMSGATSRFLTFEMGRGNKERLANTFSSALVVHIIIALVVLVVAETVGLWFLCNKLVIPEGRMRAAHWVYQLSILSSMLTITQVPYNSSIIAHEKMDIYAYVEILNVMLKLFIVYLLLIGNFDKLILYAILMFIVSFIIIMVYRIYCIRHYEECHFRWVWDKEILNPILSFSGWDIFGNFAVTSRQQGTNFFINMFFGVVYNAASSVASTVSGMLAALCQNILTAFRPQIIKQYSAGKQSESVNLLYNAGKFSTILMLLLTMPFCLEMDYIMFLWLKNPPEYAASFCRFMMISGIINMCEMAMNIGIHATGKVQKMSFYTGFCYLGSLPIVWMAYQMGMSVEFAYYFTIVLHITNLFIRGWILKQDIVCFSMRLFVAKVILPVLMISILTFCALLPSVHFFSDGILRCVIVFATDVIVGGILTLIIALNKEQRQRLFDFVKTKFLHRSI